MGGSLRPPQRAEIERLGRAGVGVAHCPSSNLLLGARLAPVAELLAAGAPVGLGCDGSSSADSASLWLEARTAMLLARYRSGAASTGARQALELGDAGGGGLPGPPGRARGAAPGAVGDLVCWRLDGPTFAGALSDPVEALLRCGPGRPTTPSSPGGRSSKMANSERGDRGPPAAPPGGLGPHPGPRPSLEASTLSSPNQSLWPD